MKSDRIENIVFEVLEDILKRPRDEIVLSHLLVNDLKIDSDDFSFLFVPKIEQLLKIQTSQNDWDRVFTVQDVINVLKLYLE